MPSRCLRAYSRSLACRGPSAPTTAFPLPVPIPCSTSQSSPSGGSGSASRSSASGRDIPGRIRWPEGQAARQNSLTLRQNNEIAIDCCAADLDFLCPRPLHQAPTPAEFRDVFETPPTRSWMQGENNWYKNERQARRTGSTRLSLTRKRWIIQSFCSAPNLATPGARRGHAENLAEREKN